VSTLLAQSGRPFLTAVRTLHERIRFCSRCGMVRDERERQGDTRPAERVCPDCGMGVLLAAPREALPGEGMSFLIVTDDLRISAVSEAAERIFGGPEADLIGTNLLRVMTSPEGDDELALRVARAATGTRAVRTIPVRLLRGDRPAFGRLEARVASCGPPRGALVALDPITARLP
jgi:PAS domain S-box-containing protein